MRLLNFFDWFSKPEAPAQIVRRNSRREQEIYKLVMNGRITLDEIKGNCPSKEIWRLRKAGFVYPDKHHSERWEVNPKTGCLFKVYSWTGKLPANWVNSWGYTGLERRKKPRGNA